MSPFITAHVDCRVTGDRATLLEPVVYRGRVDAWVVPAGFSTDFATVPRLATWLVPRMGAHTLAAIVHDWLCHLIEVGDPGAPHPVDADGIFRRVMREEGASFPRRWLAWGGVRLGALVKRRRRRGWWRTLPQLSVVAAAAVAPVVAVWVVARRWCR